MSWCALILLPINSSAGDAPVVVCDGWDCLMCTKDMMQGLMVQVDAVPTTKE